MKTKKIPSSIKHYVNVLVVFQLVLLEISFPKFPVFPFLYYIELSLILYSVTEKVIGLWYQLIGITLK